MLLSPQDHSVSALARTTRQSWLVTWACLAAAGIALCVLFAHEVEGAVNVWFDSNAYNHCFLIIPVALYLGWHRRGSLAGLEPTPDARALALLVPLALMWLAAARLSVLEAQQLVVVAMFEVIALACVGPVIFRALLTPFLYLFFLVPTGYFLVPWLQNFTADFIVAGLHLVGIPVYSDGTLIEIPAGSFVVAEACAGLRFLIASVAFGVLFSAIMYRSRVRWLAFVALSIVVPIIANGMRAFGILVLAEVTGSPTAVMADHIIYGWGFFSAVTVLLIAVGMTFADRREDDGVAARGALAQERPETRPWMVAVVALVGLAIAATGPGFAEARDWRSASANFATAAPPAMAPRWHAVEDAEPGWKPLIIDPDREFLDRFTDGSVRIIRYVALYETGGFHNNLVRSQNAIADEDRWKLTASGKARTTLHGRRVTVATTGLARGLKRLTVWDFYVVTGRIVPSPMTAKLDQLRTLFGGDSGVAAFVAIAIETPESAPPPNEVLSGFLNDMTPLPDYLGSLAAR
jgi:exosortase A